MGLVTIYITSGYIYIPADIEAKRKSIPCLKIKRRQSIYARENYINRWTCLLPSESIVVGLWRKQLFYGTQAGSPAAGKRIPQSAMGYAAYSALPEQTTNCLNQPALLGNVKEIDAFLFADNEVTGMILYDAFKINGE